MNAVHTVAIVSGSAIGVEGQRAEAVELVKLAGIEPVYCAINDAGISHPNPLQHWVSLHPDNFGTAPEMWEERRADRFEPRYTRWGSSKGHFTDRITRRWTGGSSGLLACDAMLQVVDAVILCGVPIDDRLNVYTQKRWAAADRFRLSWERHFHELTGRVTSLSGWTKGLLGSPTLSWLEGLEVAA